MALAAHDVVSQQRLSGLESLYRSVRLDGIGWEDFAVASQLIPDLAPLMGIDDIINALPMSSLLGASASEKIELTRFAAQGVASRLTDRTDGEFAATSVGNEKVLLGKVAYGTKVVISRYSVERALVEGLSLISRMQEAAGQIIAEQLRKVLWYGDGQIYGIRNVDGVPVTALTQTFAAMTFDQAMTAISGACETVRAGNYLRKRPNRLLLAPSIYTTLAGKKHATTGQSVLEALASLPAPLRMEVYEIAALDAVGSSKARMLLYYEPGGRNNTLSIELPTAWQLYATDTDGLSNTSYYICETGGIIAPNLSPATFCRYFAEP